MTKFEIFKQFKAYLDGKDHLNNELSGDYKAALESKVRSMLHEDDSIASLDGLLSKLYAKNSWNKELIENERWWLKNKRGWLKEKIKNHLDFTNGDNVSIRRDYKRNIVVIDYFGGATIKYDYNGNWVAG